jgi:hypothetical protein
MKQLAGDVKLKFDAPLYISVDMDALDPGFAPGVSHQEPGGLSTRQVINMIHSLDASVVGGETLWNSTPGGIRSESLQWRDQNYSRKSQAPVSNRGLQCETFFIS